MGYPQKGTLLNYFSPDAAAPVIVIDIGASSADAGELSCFRGCTINRLMFHVTDEAVVGTSTAPTVVFTKRPTPNSDTDESAVGTLTIPDGTAVGKMIYKDLDTPITFEPGDVLEISHTVGVGGSVAGQGIANAICEDTPEEPGNVDDMMASS